MYLISFFQRGPARSPDSKTSGVGKTAFNDFGLDFSRLKVELHIFPIENVFTQFPLNEPTGHGPEGCDENGPAAALLVGYVSI